MSRGLTFLLLLSATWVSGFQAARAINITVKNAGFEEEATVEGVYVPATDWDAFDPDGTGTLNDGGFLGTWVPDPLAYNDPDFPTDSQAGFVYNDIDPNQEIGFQQTTAAILAPGATYDLSVDVGNPGPVPGFSELNGFPGYRVELVADAGPSETVLVADDSLAITEKSFRTSELNYTAPSTGPLLGQTLTIRLVKGDGPGLEVDFDSVSLVTDAIISLEVEIDRDTGSVSLSNTSPTATAFRFTGASLQSAAGALNPSQWKSIAGNYDFDGPNLADGGALIGTVDDDDTWTEQTASSTELTESQVGGPGSQDGGELVDLQEVDLGSGAWIRSPFEDVAMEILLPNGVIYNAPVTYTGTELAIADLNTDGVVNEADWPRQRDNFNANLSGMTVVEAYFLGDLNNDGLNNFLDQYLFKQAYENARGAGSFAAMIRGVPEPSSLVLLALGGVLLAWRRDRLSAMHWKGVAALLCATTIGLWAVAGAQAASIGISFMDAFDNPAAQLAPNEFAGVPSVAQINWNTNGDGDPNQFGTGTEADIKSPIPGSLADSNGDATTATITWTADGTWSTYNGTDTPDAKLMNGYLDATEAGGNATVTVGSIPYDLYDVYVYFGSDENGRTGQVTDGNTATFAYKTFSNDPNGGGGFDPSDYRQTTDTQTTDPNAFPNANYAVFEGLTQDSLTIDVIRGSNNSGIHGIQLIEDTGQLTLEVNTATGATRLLNNSGNSHTIDYYEITSDMSSLDDVKWQSLEDQNASGFPAGNGTGNGWEELGNLDDSILAEIYLQSSSEIVDGADISLGRGYDAAKNKKGVLFKYHEAGVNPTLVEGLIEYVISGDVNGDGQVNDLDVGPFVDVLLNGTSDPAARAQADMNGDGLVNGLDVAPFVTAVGASGGAAAGAVTAVPEPSTFVLLSLVCLPLFWRFRSDLWR